MGGEARTRAEPGNLEYRRRRNRRRRWATTTVIGLAFVGGGALLVKHLASIESPYSSNNAAPSAHRGLTPLGHPPNVPHGAGTFSFSAEQVTSHEPVAYDPCRTVPWAIHDELAPPGTQRIVEDAVRAVADATGLVFVRRQAGPDDDYHSVTAKQGRSPVIIDWTTAEEVRSLVGSTAGVGGSAFLPDAAGRRIYVTGAVALDAPQIRGILERPDGEALTRAIVMHELAHVVGLDHVDDRNELMYGQGVTRTTFGPGDREGLAALGSGHCI